MRTPGLLRAGWTRDCTLAGHNRGPAAPAVRRGQAAGKSRSRASFRPGRPSSWMSLCSGVVLPFPAAWPRRSRCRRCAFVPGQGANARPPAPPRGPEYASSPGPFRRPGPGAAGAAGVHLSPARGQMRVLRPRQEGRSTHRRLALSGGLAPAQPVPPVCICPRPGGKCASSGPAKRAGVRIVAWPFPAAWPRRSRCRRCAFVPGQGANARPPAPPRGPEYASTQIERMFAILAGPCAPRLTTSSRIAASTSARATPSAWSAGSPGAPAAIRRWREVDPRSSGSSTPCPTGSTTSAGDACWTGSGAGFWRAGRRCRTEPRAATPRRGSPCGACGTAR